MTKENQSRITVLLQSDQVKAIKLVAIYEGESMSEIVEQAVDEHLVSRYGEEIVEGLKKATKPSEMKALFGDYVKP